MKRTLLVFVSASLAVASASAQVVVGYIERTDDREALPPRDVRSIRAHRDEQSNTVHRHRRDGPQPYQPAHRQGGGGRHGRGGAGASEAALPAAPAWAAGESVDELIRHGTTLLNEGAYDDAYYVYREAYDYAITDQEYARALFSYGYASTLVGKSAQAFENVTDPAVRSLGSRGPDAICGVA